ncbi:hypothetical protein HQ393_12385 [Chitinibacter bivalviorum]|uniref:Uncharacterized protein n=1 Tax=Chitinibacter bivalviorum TaxID=2739434 RepID=A0A7H9BJY2_9NEIS|nr:hypothetical protein [Chitinibacter bivalviorum]QLG88970.1 hypothetical protein HQ393_12385 [Chitinibacter bivalviorum]
MSMKKKLFYSLLEMLLKWVMAKKGGSQYGAAPHNTQFGYGKKPYQHKKPYYKKSRWFD